MAFREVRVFAPLSRDCQILFGGWTNSKVSADQAIAAALAATRGGHAAEVERVTDRGATWEVDVIK